MQHIWFRVGLSPLLPIPPMSRDALPHSPTTEELICLPPSPVPPSKWLENLRPLPSPLPPTPLLVVQSAGLKLMDGGRAAAFRRHRPVYMMLHNGVFVYDVVHIGVFVYDVAHRGAFVYDVAHISVFMYYVAHSGVLLYDVAHIGTFVYDVAHSSAFVYGTCCAMFQACI